MIKKLKKRVFIIIILSLSVIVLGIIILFAILNYKNIISTAGIMMERFITGGMKKDINDKTEEKANIEIEGIYYLQVKDNEIIENSDTNQNKKIEEYAIKASKKNKEEGIIGNYIYKIKVTKNDIINVTLMENEEAIMHAKFILIISSIISILSLIVIYIIAKRVSEFIVKPAEETLEKQKQFISDASHELKTPLAVIEANADVLEGEVGNNKWLNYIQNEIESMNKLINELLLLAKMENTDNLKDYKEFNLSKEIEIIISMFQSMAYEKNIILNSIIQENIIMHGNREDVEHILSTLIDNAIKHTEPTKKIEIELKKEKNEILLQVANEGKPIPENEREKVFERFYRIDKSRNRNEKRYGLGLAIAKSTVEKYKGNIVVDYKKGLTIFKVTLPINKHLP